MFHVYHFMQRLNILFVFYYFFVYLTNKGKTIEKLWGKIYFLVMSTRQYIAFNIRKQTLSGVWEQWSKLPNAKRLLVYLIHLMNSRNIWNTCQCKLSQRILRMRCRKLCTWEQFCTFIGVFVLICNSVLINLNFNW